MTDSEEVLEILADLVVGLEGLCAGIRQQLAALKKVDGEGSSTRESHPDYNQLSWVEQKGIKGPFQQASRQNSKVDVFDRLVKELKSHNGFWQHDGWKCWFHRNDETTIDRRRVGSAGEAQEANPSASKKSSSQDAKVTEGIKQKFPEELRSLLSFEEKPDAIVIRPRRFLGSDNFAKIAAIVKEHGGDYVSAGKDSHFRIPTKREVGADGRM